MPARSTPHLYSRCISKRCRAILRCTKPRQSAWRRWRRKPQARSVLLPQISGSAEWSTNDSSGSSFNINTDSTVPFSQDTDDTQWGVSLRQTVFRWDQIVGLRRADKTVAKAEATREAAQQDLIIRVAQRYFDVLAAEDRLTSINANRTAIARQLDQAKQRFDVGLIAITDVQESQAAYDQAVADEIGAKRVLANCARIPAGNNRGVHFQSRGTD